MAVGQRGEFLQHFPPPVAIGGPTNGQFERGFAAGSAPDGSDQRLKPVALQFQQGFAASGPTFFHTRCRITIKRQPDRSSSTSCSTSPGTTVARQAVSSWRQKVCTFCVSFATKMNFKPSDSQASCTSASPKPESPAQQADPHLRG